MIEIDSEMFSVVLWVYIALLLVGGIIGFAKAKSAVSLITSLIFAAILGLCAIGIIEPAYALILISLLLLLFIVRFAKSKRFMPAGLMAGASAIALVLLLIA